MKISLITNLTAIIIIILSFIFPLGSKTLFYIGLFGLSGSLTNWLAIHMLFEKIPFIYGSGVIPNKFLEFKTGLKKLIMEEFFSEENLIDFFKKDESFNLQTVINKIDKDKIFGNFLEAIEQSSLGGILVMIGGKEALLPLKEPLIEKIKDSLIEFESSQKTSNDISSNIKEKVEKIIDERLNNLSPNDVKNIIQNVIKEHLGWLVVWGGLIGGILGFLFSLKF